jgi:ABC-2 type transport system permease protein
MNIFKHEFKMNLRSVITWSLSLTLLIFAFLSIFSSLAVDAEMLNDMMSQFPEELLMAFGMDTMDFSTVLGFYSFLFIFCQICLAIQASNYGFSLVSIEEREMTADFLLAKPIGRTQILTSKLLAALASLSITNLVVWISRFVAIHMFRDGREYESSALIILLLSIILFQLFFLAVGMFVSLLMKRVRSVTPLSMALAFGMYVVNAFSGMLGDAKLELITPFRHFEPTYILSNSAYDTSLVMISIIAILISVVGSYVLYSKRNIHTAV